MAKKDAPALASAASALCARRRIIAGAIIIIMLSPPRMADCGDVLPFLAKDRIPENRRRFAVLTPVVHPRAADANGEKAAGVIEWRGGLDGGLWAAK